MLALRSFDRSLNTCVSPLTHLAVQVLIDLFLCVYSPSINLAAHHSHVQFKLTPRSYISLTNVKNPIRAAVLAEPLPGTVAQGVVLVFPKKFKRL